MQPCVSSLFNIAALELQRSGATRTAKNSVLVSVMGKVVNGKDIQVFHEKESLPVRVGPSESERANTLTHIHDIHVYLHAPMYMHARFWYASA